MNKKCVAIVGAGPGISAGVARKFGANGFTVILLARHPESLQLRVSELKNAGIEAHGLVADVTDPQSLQSAFARIQAEHGILDALVYNAGANTIANPSVLNTADLTRDFVVNVVGALSCAQLAAPAMIERGSGSILFTGGLLALNPVASRASASISKAGLRNLTLTLGDELAEQGLKVGTVTIGGVVQAGTFFDPDLIAEAYWDLHTGKSAGEVLYMQP
ncbi:SDR family NAD(P)-dependent oxidoreductase [Paenarthrobacter sp. PH39-S1]|uniref:SDR family NAD(P)-dependent oxidoreductase n=1 Tax=Paenarthrobacter sp. PH39-S1 TaxID=3046204 RepID=UPI0024B93C85|nr:SDR family NAD(P)-dependent oxidoreductase [Paenarthrobacter sp. PH39-S1]MDJ0357956.1 SDR family NAD(P)-dependent oxidoreductase [Paenarthrobacter sp. PH39-S1]